MLQGALDTPGRLLGRTAAPPSLPGSRPCFLSKPCRQQRRASRHLLRTEAAKKGGKKGGGGQKKGGSSIADLLKPKQPWEETKTIMHNLLLIENHRRKVGSPILEDIDISEAANALWEAPFAVLSHDKFENEDPVFTYANKAALDLFEATWEQLVGMPSRQSAADEPEAQQDRNQVLEAAADGGVIRDFTAWRLTLQGNRVQIRNATLFNLETPTGKKVGQATTIYHWVYEDGTEGGPGAAGAPESTERPTEEEIARAEEAVQEQAALVRALKEEHGLGNDDAEVVEHVGALKRRKAKLEALLQRAQAADAAAAAAAAAGGDGAEAAGADVSSGAQEAAA